MNSTALFYLCVFLLFSLPLLPALLELWLKKDATPLKVVREYDGNINFFALTFRHFVAQHFAQFLDTTVVTNTASQYKLQDGSAFQIVGVDRIALFSAAELSSRQTQQIIIAKSGFKVPDGMFFEKEVYSRQDVIGANKLSFRAILADGDIRLGDQCSLIRWVHSQQSIQLGLGAKIYGRISAEKKINLSADTRFGRMHAPVIYFGADSASEVEGLATSRVLETVLENKAAKNTLNMSSKILDDTANRWLAKGDYTVSRNTQHQGSLVAQMDLRIEAHCHIVGSIKSSGDLYLDDCCVIEGAVVAEGTIYIGQSCRIKGPVIGEKTVHIGTGTVIGAAEQLTTITAPIIRIAYGVIAHGAVWAREMGYVAAPILKK